MKTLSSLLLSTALLPVLLATGVEAQAIRQTKGDFDDKFRQLEGEAWPTPNEYRNAGGAPGYRYWQQKVDYKIKATLNEQDRTITGVETITYHNNSPDELPFIWMMLEYNIDKKSSLGNMTQTVGNSAVVSPGEIRRNEHLKTWQGGYRSIKVTDEQGREIPFTVVDTQMRLDLAKPLKAGEKLTYQVTWTNAMPDSKLIGGRSGVECFTKKDEDGNCIFEAAHWFPRLAVYSDYEGWHTKAFLGAGEFTLEFGDYDLELTVPADHIVSATGALQNADQVLTAEQRKRLETAKTAYNEPIYIVTPAEAEAAEKVKGPVKTTKTWRFKAENVRDVAFASSRKFTWDAMAVKQDYAPMPNVLAMSFYPKEARPLWDTYSTKAVAHTINVYSKFALPYPYPVAQSVNGPVGGMEYPMISFNGPRPVKDKKTGDLTYSERTKTGLIGVVIHEVGHNWFPMIINSDERQWTWMDEGLNSFVEFEAERQWDPKFPKLRGEPKDITAYMASRDQVPIMTQSDSVLQFGNNAYAKPATALNILRETVLGRDLFDKAFRTYAERWRFKRPTPSDFFRTMEEVSGVDLDWFWRGWFYTTDHVDISIDSVVKARLNTHDPKAEKAWAKAQEDKYPGSLVAQRNKAEGIKAVNEIDPKVRDFYDEGTDFDVTAADKEKFEMWQKGLEDDDKAALTTKDNYYNVTFSNLGCLVMPLPVKFTFTDGTSDTVRIPAEIWRQNSRRVTWRYVTPKTVVQAELDPLWEIADADRTNNYFPRRIDEITAATPTANDYPPTTDRMKDNRLRITRDSLKTQAASKPAPAAPEKK